MILDRLFNSLVMNQPRMREEDGYTYIDNAKSINGDGNVGYCWYCGHLVKKCLAYEGEVALELFRRSKLSGKMTYNCRSILDLFELTSESSKGAVCFRIKVEGLDKKAKDLALILYSSFRAKDKWGVVMGEDHRK